MLKNKNKYWVLSTTRRPSSSVIITKPMTHNKLGYAQGLHLVVVIVAVAMPTTHWIVNHVSIPIGGAQATRK